MEFFMIQTFFFKIDYYFQADPTLKYLGQRYWCGYVIKFCWGY